MSSIAIVDLGVGNLRSVEQALRHVAAVDTAVVITSDPVENWPCRSNDPARPGRDRQLVQCV